MEIELPLLSHATIHITYLDHNFTTAVYLINRLPTNALPGFSSPLEVVHNMQLDYYLLRVFGCACYPYMSP